MPPTTLNSEEPPNPTPRNFQEIRKEKFIFLTSMFCIFFQAYCETFIFPIYLHALFQNRTLVSAKVFHH